MFFFFCSDFKLVTWLFTSSVPCLPIKQDHHIIRTRAVGMPWQPTNWQGWFSLKFMKTDYTRNCHCSWWMKFEKLPHSVNMATSCNPNRIPSSCFRGLIQCKVIMPRSMQPLLLKLLWPFWVIYSFLSFFFTVSLQASHFVIV